MIALLAGVIAMVAGTWLGAPVATPIVVGLAIGLIAPTRAARTAALAGSLAWGGILALNVLRGDSVGTLATSLGAAMSVPAWALVLVTVLYPALLASSAAWLSHMALTAARGGPQRT